MSKHCADKGALTVAEIQRRLRMEIPGVNRLISKGIRDAEALLRSYGVRI